MKVLWISQNLPYPPKTGVLQRNYHLIREASRFAEVHLVAIVKRDILPGFDEAIAVRELRKCCLTVDTVHLPIETSRVRFAWTVLRSLFTRTPFTVNWANSPTLLKTLQGASSAARFDLVYFDTISLAPYRVVFDDVARVLNHHNIESHLFERRTSHEPSPLRRFYLGQEAKKLRRYEAEAAGEFDSNLVVSELDGERLKRVCASVATAVVANGVDVDYFSRSERTPEPGHLVMVSGMNWFPNRDAVLFMTERIWPQLVSALPNARLTIVGASPPPLVVSLATRDSRVRVTGFVDDVRPYMERAQLYLCPMRDGGGTRLKILDALSMSMPIVATALALEGISLKPETDVLVADTPDAFVHQIVRVVSDPALERRLGQSGRAFVERHFSWTVIGAELERAFRQTLRARAMHV